MKRPAGRWSLTFLVLILGATSACRTPMPSDRAVEVVEVAEVGTGPARYEQAASSDELTRLLRTDLERRQPGSAHAGLEAFTYQSMEDGRATHASLVFAEVRPVLMFQRRGGSGYVTAVKALGEMLAIEAGRELSGVYSALEQGDLEAVARARRTLGSVLHEETVRLSPELRPHAYFFDGVLAYTELEELTAAERGSADLVLGPMQRAAGPFARMGFDEPFFLAQVISAQALELVGEPQRAMEKWLLAAESSFWPRAHHDLRAAIGGRIQSYSEALRAQIAGEVDQAWRARIDIIEQEARRKNDAATARIEALEADLQKARQRLESLAQALEQQRAEAERERERAETRALIRELEGRLGEARRALDSRLGASAAGPGDTLTLRGLAESSTTAVNVMRLWQGLKEAPGPGG